jgi:hypothetical protein
LVYVCHGKNSRSISIFYGKNRGINEKIASKEIDFIQKLRNILPNRDQLFKDENSIFITSINKIQKVKEVFEIFYFKSQKRDVILLQK